MCPLGQSESVHRDVLNSDVFSLFKGWQVVTGLFVIVVCNTLDMDHRELRTVSQELRKTMSVKDRDCKFISISSKFLYSCSDYSEDNFPGSVHKKTSDDKLKRQMI